MESKLYLRKGIIKVKIEKVVEFNKILISMKKSTQAKSKLPFESTIKRKLEMCYISLVS